MTDNSTPMRLHRSRRKGAKIISPGGRLFVCCTRPGEWGNKFKVGSIGVHDVATSLKLYRGSIQGLMRAKMHAVLRDKNLACYCKLCEKHAKGKPLDIDCPDCQPCHVDVIGQILYPKRSESK